VHDGEFEAPQVCINIVSAAETLPHLENRACLVERTPNLHAALVQSQIVSEQQQAKGFSMQQALLQRGGGSIRPLAAARLSTRSSRALLPVTRCALLSSVSRCRGVALARKPGLVRGVTMRRGVVAVTAVFERFTERSIKAVMMAQQEAKLMGASEVRQGRLKPDADTAAQKTWGSPAAAVPALLQVNTEHILLGLIAEETMSKPVGGYLNSGLTHERARALVEALTGRRKPHAGSESIAFSREVRRTFEAATNVRAWREGGHLGLFEC
jgi:hypothetical protein